MLSSTGTAHRTQFEEAEKLLKKAKVKDCLLGGEIYIMAEVTRAHPVQQVVRILRAPKSVSELDKLGLALFDIIEVDGKAPGLKEQNDLFTDAIGHARPPLMALVAYCYYGLIYEKSPVGLHLPCGALQVFLPHQLLGRRKHGNSFRCDRLCGRVRPNDRRAPSTYLLHDVKDHDDQRHHQQRDHPRGPENS